MSSKKKQGRGRAIGIDLGTTYSVVGVFRNGQVEILHNKNGNRTTPSVVGFHPDQALVGEGAKDEAARYPKSTIYDAKRLIGRRFSQESVQRDIAGWPFEVTGDPETDHPLVVLPPESVEGTDRDRLVSPVLVSSLILKELKGIAESALGEPVTDLVVTVPAYFNDEQKSATKQAAELAGMKVLQVMNEPTAAAMAYGMVLGDKIEGTTIEGKVLVFDLGGGTFDVSILNAQNEVFTVMAVDGDTHLGGEDFDEALRQHVQREIARKYKKPEAASLIEKDPRSLRKLLTACEKAKRVLSVAETATVVAESLAGGLENISIPVTRAKFEDLCTGLYKKIGAKLDATLAAAKLKASDIDHLVIVGGASRMAKVRKFLESKFPQTGPIKEHVHPDEAVGYGAALQAGILSGESSIEENKIAQALVLVDVTPLSVGIQAGPDQMQVLIPRNSTLPAKGEKVFTTAEDGQTKVTVRVFEGERYKVTDNNLLGSFDLEIPPAPKGIPRILVSFKVDLNGLLEVEALDQGTNKSAKKVLKREGGKADSETAKKMMDQARIYAAEDEANRRRDDAINGYEMHLVQSRNAVRGFLADIESQDYLNTAQKAKRDIAMDVMALCDAQEELLQVNRDTQGAEFFEDELIRFEQITANLMAQFYEDERILSAKYIEKNAEQQMEQCEAAAQSFAHMPRFEKD